MDQKEGRNRVIIENVKPEIDHSEFPIKRVVGDKVDVEADIFCDGHDLLRSELLYKHAGDADWTISGMEKKVNDRWKGSFFVKKQGEYHYTLRAWVDRIDTWNHDIIKKIDAEVDVRSDLAEGIQLIDTVVSAYKTMSPKVRSYLSDVAALFASDKNIREKTVPILNEELYEVLYDYPIRKFITTYPSGLRVRVERKKAAFSSWYEFFPRSLGSGTKIHGTYADCIRHLKYVADMGFDVVYLPPIHPIGESHRKGKNNAVEASPGEPGSPWAIGSAEGGHKSSHKELGTLEEFRELVKNAADHNIEIALDIAFQCSPDHPYVNEHPEWFRHRPDGTIQYAENPPKKYQDIYPFDFESEDWEGLWNELKSIFIFWIGQGVRIFRVDNPHTKSLRFWGWVIDEIHQEHPDIIFLSEAFTRPKVMYHLAKRGFTQSYTYFTWRNSKKELTRYFEELVMTDAREFFRPNLWPNTPDILPQFLQYSGKSGFITRAILAATLSSSYGIYGPAFELMDNISRDEGGEEYHNSEKYEIKDWDVERKNSLRPILKQLNKIRHENQALQNNHSLRFHEIHNENLIAYSKHTDDYSNIILTVVNLDPYHSHSGWIHFKLTDIKMKENDSYQVHDLLGGAYYLWHGDQNYTELNPGVSPAHIFRIRRKIRTEQDFDYFM
ncbi:MAG: alpha-1,4-glucan--maltose-1-phosphate maltosyltransferase [Cyclobacteriaceae bacterium]|nr:alpha-1,4-glucan--maltose-1-phosphate maltosyltransferase [Cyclobacteriaceae bacterium]